MAERSTIGQFSFNGGELSPRLRGRVDQSVYAIGAREMTGFLPTVQGPALAAPGTLFVAAAAGPCRLIPFEYNVTQGYVVEASALKLRFYTNDVRIETSPGTAYEIASPWSHAEALTLDWQQSADVLYMVGGGKAARKLRRLTATTFDLPLLDLKNGPIGDGNSDEAITVSASAATGSVTLTASAAIFASGDVGSFLELEAADFNDVPAWEPGIDGVVAASSKRAWAGNVYLAATSGRTGTVAPVHDSGTEWDGSSTGQDINSKGPYGVKWTHLYGRHGLLKITGFTSATQVTATVIKRLADSLTSVASWRWAFGAFSDTRGHPETVCIWNERLVLTKGNTAYVSVVGDYENFARRDSSGDFQRDLAGSFTLPDPATIKWSAADRLLLLGTEKAEYTVENVLIQTGAAGPPVFDVRLQATNGSKGVKPIQADGRMLFVQRAGRKLMEMGYSIESDRYQAPDLTRLAEHVGASGLGELAWAQEPERTAWAVRGDGSLAALAYSPGQQVMAWANRPMGDGLSAVSACRITDPDGRHDQIWIAATMGAAHWVLRMAKVWETGDDPAGAFFVDAGLSHAGAPATLISGLSHLNGKTVQILADGKPHPDRVVSGGQVTLDYAASTVTVGLGFAARMTLLPFEAGQQEGTAQGKLQRIIGMTLRVLETQGIRVSVPGGVQVPVETRVPADAMDTAVPLFTGDLRIDTIGGYARGDSLTVERFQPTPATILAAIPALETGET